MIKLIYEGKPYDYGNVGKQAYEVKTEITMDSDAGVIDILEAVARLMNIATYKVSAQVLKKACEDLVEEYGEKTII